VSTDLSCLLKRWDIVHDSPLVQRRWHTTVVTGMIRAKIIRRPLREAISRGFSALREIRAKGG